MAMQEKRPGESIDSLLRKFKKKVKLEGVLQELKEREFFEKPSECRKRKSRSAKRKTFLQQRAQEL
jgi:small subunit ribosomal protein S21